MSLKPEKVLEYLNNGEVEELKSYALEAMYKEAAKDSGGQLAVKQRNAAKRIIKEAKKYNANTALHGVWIEEDYQVLCTSYTAIMFNKNNHVQGIEVAPDGTRPNIIEIFETNKKASASSIEVDLKDVKLAIAKWKGDGKPTNVCYFKVGASAYNAQFLLDIIEALGVHSITIEQSTQNAAAYIATENAQAIICPLRVQEDTRTYSKEAA